MLKPKSAARKTIWIASLLFTVTFTLGLLIISRNRRKKLASVARVQQSTFDVHEELEGLSESEAAERSVKVNLEALRAQDNKDFLRRAFRQNLLTTFNIDLFIIAIIMLLLDSPWSTFGTLIVLALNVAISLFQEVTTKKMLDQHLESIRPQSTVIRERVIRSINPFQVVEDDLLVVRQGDQILLNGILVGSSEIIVEEHKPGEIPRRLKKRTGDPLYSGSFCVDGRAVYRVNEAGSQKYVKPPGRELELLYSEMTPLERMMETVLRLLFGLAIIFIPFLIIDAILADVKLVSSQFRNAISLVFGIAPTSLFFILVLQYATGARRLSRYGALVYKSTTVEKLSNVSVMCLSKSSLVSGLKVILETVPQPPDREPLTENLIRQVLGDIAHSLPVSTQTESLIAEELPGTPRRILELVSYSADRDWRAVTFEEPDLRGTFVIGAPSAMELYLDSGESEIVLEMKQTVSQAQRGLGRWLKRFTQRHDDNNSESADISLSHAGGESREKSSGQGPKIGDKPIPGWLVRVLGSMDKLLTPLEERGVPKDDNDQKIDRREVLFSYLPEPVPIRDYLGRPALPKNLIPLAYLYISDVIRPETQATIQKLIKAGTSIKIMSTDSPERTLQTAKMLGLKEDQSTIISGSDLAGMERKAFAEGIQEKTVFGDLSPSQQT
jgi:hypothetical protein